MVEHSKSSLVLIGYVSNYQCMSGPVEEVRFLCSPPNISFRLVERQHTWRRSVPVRFPFSKLVLIEKKVIVVKIYDL